MFNDRGLSTLQKLNSGDRSIHVQRERVIIGDKNRTILGSPSKLGAFADVDAGIAPILLTGAWVDIAGFWGTGVEGLVGTGVGVDVADCNGNATVCLVGDDCGVFAPLGLVEVDVLGCGSGQAPGARGAVGTGLPGRGGFTRVGSSGGGLGFGIVNVARHSSLDVDPTRWRTNDEMERKRLDRCWEIQRGDLPTSYRMSVLMHNGTCRYAKETERGKSDASIPRGQLHALHRLGGGRPASTFSSGWKNGQRACGSCNCLFDPGPSHYRAGTCFFSLAASIQFISERRGSGYLQLLDDTVPLALIFGPALLRLPNPRLSYSRSVSTRWRMVRVHTAFIPRITDPVGSRLFDSGPSHDLETVLFLWLLRSNLLLLKGAGLVQRIFIAFSSVFFKSNLICFEKAPVWFNVFHARQHWQSHAADLSLLLALRHVRLGCSNFQISTRPGQFNLLHHR
ncbi:hypothetical protein C8R47DRAFT_1079048 [Mycena vitilis]|nr:hypothetical protein C8R47DRAFT_1079048 [Mycena vitilis]